MESRGWSQLWLDYESKFAASGVANGTERKIVIECSDFDRNNRVIKSAVSELNRAFADATKEVKISFVRNEKIAAQG